MAGTKAGGLKAREANYKNFGKDYYRNIGRKGGQNGHTGGFAANPQLAREAGSKGGKISKRGKAKMKFRISRDIIEIGNVIFVMNDYEWAILIILIIAGIYLLLTGF